MTLKGTADPFTVMVPVLGEQLASEGAPEQVIVICPVKPFKEFA